MEERKDSKLADIYPHIPYRWGGSSEKDCSDVRPSIEDIEERIRTEQKILGLNFNSTVE